jgi:hypothetical protein
VAELEVAMGIHKPRAKESFMYFEVFSGIKIRNQVNHTALFVYYQHMAGIQQNLSVKDPACLYFAVIHALKRSNFAI